ncbi:unnamed protein product, partial [Amoebophrya sp. A25]
ETSYVLKSRTGLTHLIATVYTDDMRKRMHRLCQKLMTPFDRPEDLVVDAEGENDLSPTQQVEENAERLEKEMKEAIREYCKIEGETLNRFNSNGMTPLAAVLRGHFNDGGWQTRRRLELFLFLCERGADVKFPFIPCDRYELGLGTVSVYGGFTQVYSLVEYAHMR